ncbi:hypothetical protein OPV22_017085 [Ensete ventricosum]|uniref:Pentacotripeptide-repeat region of PRORP domain-containing protein n=1 Tax=Ensete ventricosum TaxID=4639 RepID=A0AAV8PEX0_ENSVE|nr:hypothetical protein OPV22_017085 [Ensete ventricosum]RWW30126.1 hypothetical protein GW17_00005305 [Ensete ventricosum]
MSSLLPIAPILSSSSPHLLCGESFFFESSFWEKHLPIAKHRRGKPYRLKALVFTCKTPTRGTRGLELLEFRRNSRFGTQTEAELLDLVEEEESEILDFVTEDGELVEEGLGTVKARPLNFAEENGMSVVDEKEEENDGRAERDVPIESANEQDETCTNRDGDLNVGGLIKRIIGLPIEERVKILDLFESDGKSLTISDCNDILTAVAKSGDHELAISFFSELPRLGITPDSWSFSIMVECLCKKKEPDEAMRFLEDMVRRGFRPNAVTFNRLMNCLCKRGRMKKAFVVVEIMSQMGCEPSIRTYNSLISGLCYVGRLEEAFELLRKIKNSSTSPDIYTYTLVIDGFCKVGKSYDARELLEEAEEMDLLPNIVTYNSLLNGYCKEGRPLEGLHLLKRMQRGDCPPDFTSYSIVLQGLLRWGEVSAAWRTYRKMRDAGFQVEEHAMNTLLGGVCRQSVIDEKVLNDAMEILDAITEIGHYPSAYTYCLMVQALAVGGRIDKALFHLHEMVRIGYCPRMMTYDVVLRVLCGGGRGDDALDVLVLMIERGTIPSKFSFGILLGELCQQGRVSDAFGVYAAATKRGVVPNWKPNKGFNVQKVIQH